MVPELRPLDVVRTAVTISEVKQPIFGMRFIQSGNKSDILTAMGKSRSVQPKHFAMCAVEDSRLHVIHFPFGDNPLYFRSDRIGDEVVSFLPFERFSIGNIY